MQQPDYRNQSESAGTNSQSEDGGQLQTSEPGQQEKADEEADAVVSRRLFQLALIRT